MTLPEILPIVLIFVKNWA